MEKIVSQLFNISRWLLETSWHAAVLIVVVLCVQRLFRKQIPARWRCGLWLLVALRLVLPAMPQSSFSIFNVFAFRGAHSPLYGKVAGGVVTRNDGVAQRKATEQGVFEGTGVATIGSIPADSPTLQAIGPTVSKARSNAFNRRKVDWRKWGALVWLIGALLFAMPIILVAVRLNRKVVLKRPVTDPDILNLLEDCKQQMEVHTPMMVIETNQVAGPMLYGFLRPRLLLPEGIFTRFTREQVRFIFLHELAHVKCWDIGFNWLIALLQVLHWFNPLVWLAFSRMRFEREVARDELALSYAGENSANAYGLTMIKLLERIDRPKVLPALAAIIEDDNQTKQRIVMIANYTKPNRRPTLAAVAVICAVILITFTDATIGTAATSSQQFLWATAAGGTNDDTAEQLTLDSSGSLYVAGRFDSDQITLGGITLTNFGGATGFGSTDGFLAKCDRVGQVMWATQFGSSGSCVARRPALDDSNNVYLCGYFNTNLFLGTTNFVSSGSFDCFLAKLDSAGNVIWARHAGSAYSDIVQSVATGPSAVYITGFFRDTINFDGQSLTVPSGSPTRGDFYLVKYDQNGNALWAQRGGGSGDDVGYSVAVDQTSGAVYACGYFQNTATFSGSSVVSAGSDDIFVAKYNAAGTLQWIQRAGGTGSDKALHLTLDLWGNVLVTGFFSGTATFGTNTLISSGGTDLFIAKYDANGQIIWANRAGGTNSDSGASICVDTAGTAFITGSLVGTVTFGSTVFSNANATNSTAFVAKYDANGNFAWLKRPQGSGSSAGAGIAVDSEERIFVGGSLSGAATFDGTSLVGNGGTDFLLTRLDEVFPLDILRTAGEVVLSWPTNAIGFTLQESSNVVTSSNWQNSAAPSVVNGQYVVTNSLSSSYKFYRLRK